MQQKTIATLAIILLLFIGTAGYFYWAMTRTYAVPSIDGPYYYIQVHSILNTGTIEYVDPPLTFYIFTAFTLAIGNTITGVLVGSAIFAGAASVAVYFLFKHIFKEQIPAIAAGLVTALAAEHIAMSVNLMKNALGIVFIIGVIYFLQRLIETQKPAKWNIAGAIGCFGLTLLTHVLDEGVALLFIVGYLVFSLLLAERKQYIRRYGPILAITALCAVLAYVLVPTYFGDFNKGVDFVSTTATSLTTSSQNGLGGSAGMGVSDPFVYLFLAVGVGLTIYEFFLGARKKAVLLGTATLIGIGLVLPFIPTAYAWRFQVMEFLPVSVIIGYACSVLTRLNRKQLAVGLMLLMLVPVAYVGYQKAVTMSPTISSEAYSELTHMASSISRDNSVLVIQGSGNAVYWPEAILNLQVVSNATVWQEQGYTVYVLVGSGQNIGGNSAGVPTNTNGTGGFAGQGGFGPGQQGQGGGFPSGGQQNSSSGNGSTSTTTTLTNATVVYSGTSYSLYKLNA